MDHLYAIGATITTTKDKHAFYARISADYLPNNFASGILASNRERRRVGFRRIVDSAASSPPALAARGDVYRAMKAFSRLDVGARADHAPEFLMLSPLRPEVRKNARLTSVPCPTDEALLV
jgi:hypothetical protein